MIAKKYHLALAVTSFIIASCMHEKENEELSLSLTAYDKFEQETTTFNLSEEITFELTISNESNETKELFFPGSSFYGLEILDLQGNLVWDLPLGRPSTLISVEPTLTPGEKFSTTHTWNQIKNNNEAVITGNYTVEGFIYKMDQVAKMDLQIQ